MNRKQEQIIKREKIIAILDKYDAWEHVIINYLVLTADDGAAAGVEPLSSGKVNRGTRTGRMVDDLSKAIEWEMTHLRAWNERVVRMNAPADAGER
jgi:hypothetical protein